MADKTPVKATFTGSDVTGLAEFTSSDTIGVVDGGTGAATLTSTAILLGNGTSAIQSSDITISSTTISGITGFSSGANTITITAGDVTLNGASLSTKPFAIAQAVALG